MIRRLAILLLLAVLGVAAWFAWSLLLPLNPQGPKFVLLRPGFSARRIAAELKQSGVLRSETAFLMVQYARGGTLKAGEYRFDSSASMLQVRQRLVQGDIYFHTVVIPEGYTLYDIAGAIEQAGLAPRQEFIDAAQSDSFLIRDLAPGAKSLEGYLFPDTYHFTRTQDVHQMIATMVRRFRETLKDIGADSLCSAPITQLVDGNKFGESPCSTQPAVTLASVVEKETGVAEERSLVASVYYNRLRLKMPLQADPSVIYAALLAGRYRGTIYVSDLHFDSPYNTYIHPGLPPGPIANPGRASLEAAISPAATNYLYFVSDNQGHHRFSRTLEEHNHNVAQYRQGVAHAR
jgi:peptidoglycan lytic transglycosylase G